MKILNQLLIDENNIAFHPDMGNSYQLNSVGKKVLDLIKLHKSKTEIIEELHQTYNISKDDLFIDVSDYLTKLKFYGLY